MSLSARAGFGSFLQNVVIFAAFWGQKAANWRTKCTEWVPLELAISFFFKYFFALFL